MFEKFEDTPLFGANLVAFQFQNDNRTDKIDLGLGVYRNEQGETPVMAAVKAAETRLLQSQTSKSYLGLLGDTRFSDLMVSLIFGEDGDRDRIAAIQTPGGVSALSLCCHLIKLVNPGARVWVSDPTWANHIPIISYAGLATSPYPYFDKSTAAVNFEAMNACLEKIPGGDVLLLQASCHNPAGADLTPPQWDRIAEICRARGILPFVDVAYQGVGDGLEEDVYGVRKLYGTQPELILASTCSKNFGVYRDRAAIAAVVSKTPEIAQRSLSQMLMLANVSHAMPPDHAAAVVREILSDPELKSQWQSELAEVRHRIRELRESLVTALRRSTNSEKFDFLAQHKGMYSLLPLTDAQIDLMREKHGIYLVKGGRVNVAGLRTGQVDRFAEAIADVMRFSGDEADS